MRDIWKKSEKLNHEKQGEATKKALTKKDGTLKILDYSKSTLNGEEDDVLQERIKAAQRQGLIDFSFGERHIDNIDNSRVCFADDSLLSIGDNGHAKDQNCRKDQLCGLSLREKIEFNAKVEKLKRIADDSRLDDSRKYLINGDTPEFGQKELSPKKRKSEVNSSDVKERVKEFLDRACAQLEKES